MLDMAPNMRVDFGSREEQLAHYRAIQKRLRFAAVPKPIEKIPEPEPIEPEPIVEVVPVHVVTEPEVAVPVTLEADAPVVLKYPKVAEIQRLVARHYDIPLNDMVSVRRQKRICRARMVAIYLAKILTVYSYPKIGFYFGNRDHTTILHAVRKVTELMLADSELASTVAMFEQVLTAQCNPAA